MAMIKCPECGKEISDKANSCPNCGYTFIKNINESKRKQRKMFNEKVTSNFTVALLIIALFYFAQFFLHDTIFPDWVYITAVIVDIVYLVVFLAKR